MELPVKERLKQKMKDRRVKIPTLAELVDIPKGRIYGWYRDGTNPKAEDLQKLEKWIAGETFIKNKENVKRETEQINTAIDPLHDLITSNRRLADAALINAEANKLREEKELKLVQSNAELTLMLKQSEGFAEENHTIDLATLVKIQDLLAEIGAGKKWHSKKEALRAVGIALGLHVGDKGNQAGTRTGEHRKSTA